MNKMKSDNNNDKQEYYVEVKHVVMNGYKIKAESKKQVKRIFDRLLLKDAITQHGVSDLSRVATKLWDDVDSGKLELGGAALKDVAPMRSIKHDRPRGNHIDSYPFVEGEVDDVISITKM